MRNLWTRIFSRPELVLLSLSWLLSSCGLVDPGTLAPPDDPPPQGTLIAQGNLQGIQPHEAEGWIRLYRTPEGEMIARLESFFIEGSSLNHKIEVFADNQKIFDAPLKAPTGDQNYNMGAISAASWEKIEIVSPPSGVIARSLLSEVARNDE